MDVQTWLTSSTRQLDTAGLATARLDCQVLLADALHQDRAWLLAHSEYPIPPQLLTKLTEAVAQRVSHEPLAYIRGHTEFYGRDFIITPDVLVPRPESEAIIELALQIDMLDYRMTRTIRCADIGTGSGCLGLTLALERPGWSIDLYDIDARALAVASQNARNLAVGTRLWRGDLLDEPAATYHLLIANLPYVPTEHAINRAATFEPAIALFSGSDGLGHYRRLWQSMVQLAPRPSHIISEALPEQHAALQDMAQAAGYSLHASNGYAQHFIATD